MMVSQPIWIAIVIIVFFVGIGASYAHFANTYDPMSMKFQNQELFDQMMSNNPRMSQQWMDSGMMNSMMSTMQFSTNAPMTMPLIDGYHNGEKMFFIHTEVSDNSMAQMMSTMINFPIFKARILII